MKLRVSKKKFILLVVLFFIFLISGVYLLERESGWLGLDFSEGLDKYGELEEYCEYKNGEDLTSVLCYGFLKDEYIGEDGSRCLELALTSLEGIRKDIEICEDSEKILWKNPYPDYYLSVPVIFELNYSKSIFGNYFLEEINFDVMEDEKAEELLDLVNSLDSLGFLRMDFLRIQTKEEYYIQKRGYRIFNTEDGGQRLLLSSVVLKEYEVKDGEVFMYVDATLYGESVDLVISNKEFILSQWVPTTPEEIQEVMVDLEGVEVLSEVQGEGSCEMLLSFEVEESTVHSYLENLLTEQSSELVRLELLDLRVLICEKTGGVDE